MGFSFNNATYGRKRTLHHFDAESFFSHNLFESCNVFHGKAYGIVGFVIRFPDGDDQYRHVALGSSPKASAN